MKHFLVAFSLIVSVAAQDVNTNEVYDSYEAVRQSYAYVRATMATPTDQSQSLLETLKYEALAALKKECDKQSPEAFNKFKVAQKEYMQCVRLAAKTADIPRTRNTSTVIKTVCGISPQFLSCFDKVRETVKPCFVGEQRNASIKRTQAVHDVVNHLCYQDGLRVTMFMDNGGYACVSQKKTDLVSCLNSTLLTNISEGGSNHMLKYLNSVETCRKIDQIHTCVKSKLEECSTSSAADFVEGIMEVTKNAICIQ